MRRTPAPAPAPALARHVAHEAIDGLEIEQVRGEVHLASAGLGLRWGLGVEVRVRDRVRVRVRSSTVTARAGAMDLRRMRSPFAKSSGWRCSRRSECAAPPPSPATSRTKPSMASRSSRCAVRSTCSVKGWGWGWG